MIANRCLYIIFVLLPVIRTNYALPEQGSWTHTFKIDDAHPKNETISFVKTMFSQSSVKLTIKCHSSKHTSFVNVDWILRMSSCAEEYAGIESRQEELYRYYDHAWRPNTDEIFSYKTSRGAESIKCGDEIFQYVQDQSGEPYTVSTQTKNSTKPMVRREIKAVNLTGNEKAGLITKTWADGAYLLLVHLSCPKNLSTCTSGGTVIIEMRSSYGFLSAIEWPFLIFYGTMCVLYLLFGLFWLVFSACYWRDILRVQFWIGAVIFLGMLEKAFFYAEYQSINLTGQSVRGAVIVAELVSCLKRTLARLLIMVVCIGYGIVKPRLGPALHKVVAIGIVYFIFAVIEGCIRVLRPRFEGSQYALWASLPLALVDALIIWWTFSYLFHTLKQTRLRRNVVKYNLYRHFSNILIIVIVASIVFMGWSLYSHRSGPCIRAWKELWVDEAFWHLLFSVVLLVIIWLWRPSTNNQRYAYSPVLDADDGLDGDEDVLMDNMSSGDLKRVSKGKENGTMRGNEKKAATAEDDLRWIEENIPSSAAEQVFPLLDSDEEITPAKLSATKME